MKAPDKMYIGSCDPSLGRGFATASVEKMKSDDIKYIRKDALLEWLESKIYEYNEDRFDDGFNTALGQVIDKINSM